MKINFIIPVLICFGLDKEQDRLMEHIFNFVEVLKIQLVLKYRKNVLKMNFKHYATFLIQKIKVAV